MENMSEEIIEAISNYFEGDEDTISDCMLYLSNLTQHSICQITNKAMEKLDEMNRCVNCGTPLEIIHYKEYHLEINTVEQMAEIYCPYCDIRR